MRTQFAPIFLYTCTAIALIAAAVAGNQELPVAQQHKKKQAIHIRVVTVEAPPFMMKRKLDATEGKSAGSNGSLSNQTASPTQLWHGYCMDFFLELIKHLPYEVSYEIYAVPDGMFGSKRRQIIETGNGTNFKRIEPWTGLVGELERGKAELALAPMAVMAERELVIDFTVPFYDLVGIQILLKRPEVPQNWFKFLTVLDNDVWLSIGVAYFITSFIIYLFDRLSPYSHKNLARIKRVRRGRGSSAEGAAAPADSPANFNQFYLSRSLVGKTAPESGGTLSLSARIPALQPLGGGVAHLRRISRDYLDTLSDNQQLDEEEEDEDENEKPDFNLRDSLWFCITSLTPQGGGEAPQNLSGRVVAGAWWLFCFIVIASYTANLAAFLTVSRLDIPVESLDDLAKQYRIKYAPIDGTAAQTYFERMAYIEEIFYNIWKDMSLNDSLAESERSKFAVWDYPISDKYTKIWAQIQEVGMPANQELALERIRDSKLDDGFALLADANLIKYAIMTDCQLKAVGEEFSRKPVALGVRKGRDELRDALSYAILQLINRRFMEVLRERWWTSNPARVVCESRDESEGISIDNIGGVFIIIATGITLSFAVWALEQLAYNTKLEVSHEMLLLATENNNSNISTTTNLLNKEEKK